MNLRAVILLTATLLPNLAWAGNPSFDWDDHMCSYHSVYDGKKVSAEELAGANDLRANHRMLRDRHFFGAHNLNPTPLLLALDSEFQALSGELKALRLPKAEIWEKIRQSEIVELTQIYTLMQVQYRSYDDPAILKTFPFHDSCMDAHAGAMIAGGDSLLRDWKRETARQAANNGSPKKIWETFAQQSKSPDKLLYARFEIMHFGWWNCAMAHVDMSETEYSSQARFEAFEKLFLKTDEGGCETED